MNSDIALILKNIEILINGSTKPASDFANIRDNFLQFKNSAQMYDT